MKILHRAQHRARIPVPSPYCNVVQESVRQLSWVSRLLLCWGWLESQVTDWTGRDLSQKINNKKIPRKHHTSGYLNLCQWPSNYIHEDLKKYPTWFAFFWCVRFYILFVWYAVKFLLVFLDVFWYAAFDGFW